METDPPPDDGLELFTAGLVVLLLGMAIGAVAGAALAANWLLPVI